MAIDKVFDYWNLKRPTLVQDRSIYTRITTAGARNVYYGMTRNKMTGHWEFKNR